jgi:hypothetical protein
MCCDPGIVPIIRDAYAVQTALLKRFQKIIDTIPTTEDGVKILPGMTLWHRLRGMKFADGSPAYIDNTVTWLGWHHDRSKRQKMYFSVAEEVADFYDGTDWYFYEEELEAAIEKEHEESSRENTQ